jgi:hypothetical protein
MFLSRTCGLARHEVEVKDKTMSSRKQKAPHGAKLLISKEK